MIGHASTLSRLGVVPISSTANTEGTKSRFPLLCFLGAQLTAESKGRQYFGAVWLSLLALLIADACVAAPLEAELRPVVMQPRTGAPEWIDVRLTSASTSLLEGTLELTALDDGSPAFVYRTQELALTTGTRAFRLLLPISSLPLTSYTLDRDVQVRFLVKGGAAWDLGKFPLHPRLHMERSLVLAFGRSGLHADEASARLWQSLRLERFAPEKPASTPYGFITTPVMIEPDDFPADRSSIPPLMRCCSRLPPSPLLRRDHATRSRSGWQAVAALACSPPGRSALRTLSYCASGWEAILPRKCLNLMRKAGPR